MVRMGALEILSILKIFDVGDEFEEICVVDEFGKVLGFCNDHRFFPRRNDVVGLLCRKNYWLFAGPSFDRSIYTFSVSPTGKLAWEDLDLPEAVVNAWKSFKDQPIRVG